MDRAPSFLILFVGLLVDEGLTPDNTNDLKIKQIQAQRAKNQKK
jgi:hypothetical protein